MEQPDRQHKGLKLSRRSLLRGMVYSTLALTGSIACAQSDNLEIVRADVSINGLPTSLDGFSIGVMSDFHAGSWGNENVISTAIASMQRLKPDLITLTGDFVDGLNSHDDQNIENSRFLFQALELLKAPHGVYAVLGNHDHWTNSKRVTELLTARNIIVLKDENRTLENGLVLVGVDDYWEGPGNTMKALSGVEAEKPAILLSHNPDINGDLADKGPIRLVIAGHTHGGQIRVPLTYWAPWVPCNPRYKGKSGLFAETPERWTFISKGVGTFLFPLRLSCPPDIALLTLRGIKT